jgi:DnaJ family protein A protein 5
MFVRKRDPRYKAHLKHQSQPPTTSSARPQVLQTDAEPPTVYVEQEWQKICVSGVEDLEWALAEGNDDPEAFECAACGKLFKSEAAWNSHERSKKHIKNVEVLRLQMGEEGRKLGLSDPSDELGSGPTEGSEQSEGSLTPPLDDGPGTEHGDPRGAQEPREQAASVEETLLEGTDETEQPPSQSDQKLSKRDKRRLREAKKQAQEVESTHVSGGRSC